MKLQVRTYLVPKSFRHHLLGFLCPNLVLACASVEQICFPDVRPDPAKLCQLHFFNRLIFEIYDEKALLRSFFVLRL